MNIVEYDVKNQIKQKYTKKKMFIKKTKKQMAIKACKISKYANTFKFYVDLAALGQ